MCCNNSSRSSCGCGCGCQRPRPCCSCGCGGGATTLPAFPDWATCGCQRQEPEMEFPVYISMPATMMRGTANLTATAERVESGCGCGRG